MPLPLKKKVTLRISNPVDESGVEHPEGFFKKAPNSDGFVFVSREFKGNKVCYSSELSFGKRGSDKNPYIQFVSKGNYVTTERTSKIQYSWDSHVDTKEDSELLDILGLQ